MTLLPVFRWLGETRIAAVVANSMWLFVSLEVLHLLALAMLAGAILLNNLRVLGWGVPGGNLRTSPDLRRVAVGSLLVLIVSGVLLLSTEALQCYANAAFRLKMLLLGAAVGTSWWVDRRSSRVTRPSALLKFGAVTSLVLWLGVAVAGRAIGLI